MKHLLLIETTPLNYVVAGTGELDDLVRLGIEKHNDKKWQVVQPIYLHSPFNSNQSKTK